MTLSQITPLFFPREISLLTAIQWLHHLGFKPVSHKKGVYIDGYEREDVVKHHNELLKVFHELRSSHHPLPLCSDPRVCLEHEHDEMKELYHG